MGSRRVSVASERSNSARHLSINTGVGTSVDSRGSGVFDEEYLLSQLCNHMGTLQEYEIMDVLGMGGTGDLVLRARHLSGEGRNAMVALKVCTGDRSDPKARRDIEALRMCQHPHVVKLLEVVVGPGCLAMSMELASEDLLAYTLAWDGVPGH